MKGCVQKVLQKMECFCLFVACCFRLMSGFYCKVMIASLVKYARVLPDLQTGMESHVNAALDKVPELICWAGGVDLKLQPRNGPF